MQRTTNITMKKINIRMKFENVYNVPFQESNRSEPSAQYPHLQCPPTFQPETYSLSRPPRPRDWRPAPSAQAPPTVAKASPPQRKPRPCHTSLLHAHGALVIALAKSGRKLDVSLPFIGNRTVNSTAGQFNSHSMKDFRISNTNLLELQIQIKLTNECYKRTHSFIF